LLGEGKGAVGLAPLALDDSLVNLGGLLDKGVLFLEPFTDSPQVGMVPEDKAVAEVFHLKAEVGMDGQVHNHLVQQVACVGQVLARYFPQLGRELSLIFHVIEERANGVEDHIDKCFLLFILHFILIILIIIDGSENRISFF